MTLASSSLTVLVISPNGMAESFGKKGREARLRHGRLPPPHLDMNQPARSHRTPELGVQRHLSTHSTPPKVSLSDCETPQILHLNPTVTLQQQSIALVRDPTTVLHPPAIGRHPSEHTSLQAYANTEAGRRAAFGATRTFSAQLRPWELFKHPDSMSAISISSSISSSALRVNSSLRLTERM